MIYAALPVGFNYGWGVMGRNIVLEMARLREIRLLLAPEDRPDISDEIDAWLLSDLLLDEQESLQTRGERWMLDGPVIQAAVGRELLPQIKQVAPPYDVGFAVFEQDVLDPKTVERIKREYRHLAAGSTYCAEVLKRHGYTAVSTVFHGVDTTVFHPQQDSREAFTDSFVVYSGGKFELRKGQDVVIRAYKVLQDRHADVMLLNSWQNHWPESRDTMAGAPLIRYFPPTGNTNHHTWVSQLLAANGIDVDRVLTLGMRNNRLLPRVYHNTDVGLFPNRVEGGTNMVMMEYMACGKPVVGAFHSGHTDVLRDECAMLIRRHRPIPVHDAIAGFIGNWNEPDLEETIEHLEWCYQNRDRLKVLGAQAAVDMSRFTWKRVAEGLLNAVGDPVRPST